MIERVRIHPEAWRRMDLYVECCETEIGGLGLGTLEGSTFQLEEVVLIEQHVTDYDTLLTPDGLARFLHNLVEGGGDPSRVKVWWHSHANHSLHWSMQDEETIRVLNNDYLLSLIGNKSGEWLCRLDLVGPPARTIDPVSLEPREPTERAQPADPELRAAIEQEIAEKVKTWELVRIPGQSGYFFGTEIVTSDYSYALESYGSFLLPWEGSQGGSESEG